MLASVVPVLDPENMSIGGSNETIWSQLFGAMFGFPAADTVDIRVVGPGMRLGLQLRLSVGYDTFSIVAFIVQNPAFYVAVGDAVKEGSDDVQ